MEHDTPGSLCVDSKKYYGRKTFMEQVEDKGPPKEIGRSNQRSKIKISAKKRL